MTTSAVDETALPDGLGFDFDNVAAESEAIPAPAQSRGTRTGTRRRRGAGSKRLDALQSALSAEMFKAGALLGLAVPVTGYYIGQESDAFTKAIVKLAARRPEWVEALEHIADIGPGITIARTGLGIGAAFAVDRGRADPEKKAMMFLGVYSAWKAVNEPGMESEEGSAYKPPPSGAFVPLS